MRELIAARCAKRLLDDVSPQRFLEHLQEPVLGEIVDQERELLECELPPDRRGNRQSLVTWRGESIEQLPDRLPPTLREAHAPPVRHHARLTPSGMRTLHWSGMTCTSGPRAPSSDSSRTTSLTKNGFPSV